MADEIYQSREAAKFLKRRPEAMKQTALLLSRDDKLAALAAIPPDRVGLSRLRWAQVVDLLTQIELRTGRGVCHCYAETLRAVMNRGVGVPETTFHRIRRAAERAGLLAKTMRHDGRRQQSNEWRIQWDRVSGLAAGVEVNEITSKPAQLAAPKGGTLAEKSGTPGRQSGARGRQSDTLYQRISSAVVQHEWSTVDDADQKKRSAAAIAFGSAAWWTPERIEEARRLARQVVRKIGRPCRDPRDRELVIKAAALALGPLCEAWLADAVAGVIACRPAKPWAYLQTCLAEGAELRGVNLWGLLRRVTVPPAAVAPPSEAEREPVSRLCQTEALA